MIFPYDSAATTSTFYELRLGVYSTNASFDFHGVVCKCPTISSARRGHWVMDASAESPTWPSCQLRGRYAHQKFLSVVWGMYSTQENARPVLGRNRRKIHEHNRAVGRVTGCNLNRCRRRCPRPPLARSSPPNSLCASKLCPEQNEPLQRRRPATAHRLFDCIFSLRASYFLAPRRPLVCFLTAISG